MPGAALQSRSRAAKTNGTTDPDPSIRRTASSASSSRRRIVRGTRRVPTSASVTRTTLTPVRTAPSPPASNAESASMPLLRDTHSPISSSSRGTGGSRQAHSTCAAARTRSQTARGAARPYAHTAARVAAAADVSKTIVPTASPGPFAFSARPPIALGLTRRRHYQRRHHQRRHSRHRHTHCCHRYHHPLLRRIACTT